MIIFSALNVTEGDACGFGAFRAPNQIIREHDVSKSDLNTDLHV